jgi:hypothetical protein
MDFETELRTKKLIVTSSENIEREPNNARPWFLRGTSHLRLGQTEMGLQDLQTAYTLSPK